jgi:hypothetical protein
MTGTYHDLFSAISDFLFHSSQVPSMYWDQSFTQDAQDLSRLKVGLKCTKWIVLTSYKCHLVI